MFIISTLLNLIRKTFAVITLLIFAANRWVAFIAHLIMMFFIWNSLLAVIGFVSSIQMVIGFGFDLLKITTTTTAIDDNSTIENTKEKIKEDQQNQQRSGLNEYWQGRRKVFQEFIDSLYIKYMSSLAAASNPPNINHQYWEWQQQQSHHRFYEPGYVYPIKQDIYHHNNNAILDEDSATTSSPIGDDNISHNHNHNHNHSHNHNHNHNHNLDTLNPSIEQYSIPTTPTPE